MWVKEKIVRKAGKDSIVIECLNAHLPMVRI